MKTPLERLAQLTAQDLVAFQPGATLAALQAQAKSQTDLAAAQAKRHAKRELFASFVKPCAEPDTYPRRHPPNHCRAALARQTECYATGPAGSPAGSKAYNRNKYFSNTQDQEHHAKTIISTALSGIR